LQPIIHPSLLRRKIIHFDMDAFYASIEMRDDPHLRGRPVVVGGSPNSRAVVCTANYEARRFGIRSAMACSRAARLCPQAIFISPNFQKYSAVSHEIRKIFLNYSPKIEPLSLDEAYIDVTDHLNGRYAVKIAKQIQDEVLSTTQLTGSAGVAPNKLLAKIASDMRKPHGLTAVMPAQALDFMGPLPLRKIHGIGPVSEKRLAEAGLHHCRDVWKYSREELIAHIGNYGDWLYDASRGIDDREVETSWVRKSLGREETFSTDILEIPQILSELKSIAIAVTQDLHDDLLQGRTITLKIRYDDFTRITRSRTLKECTNDPSVIESTASELLSLTDAGRRKIRLVGISISNLINAAENQTEITS
jgi:DNA polymerase IV